MQEPIVDTSENKILGKTFFLMFLGLLGTALVAIYLYSSGRIMELLTSNMLELMVLVEFLVVILFSLLFKKLPASVVTILYFVYAFINGVSFSLIFAAFELNSIIYLFVAAAALFAIFAYMGYRSKKDLSNWSNYLMPLLLICLIVSIVNIFLGNSLLDIILDLVILILFFAITMYDMNKIKELQHVDGIDQNKIYVYGAMELYLDFINIFIRILSIFGRRKD